jgi:NAD(P)-dependent dehydrogenase (short-subunit alcohol dehydrogenase family)
MRLGKSRIMSQTEEKSSPSSKVPMILVTGAFSGLGRAFFEHFATGSRDDESSSHGEIPDYRVVGIDRQPWTDQEGKRQPSHIHGPRSVYVQVDVTSPRHELDAFVHRWIGAEAPIHLVIHSAGVRGLVPSVEVRKSDDVAAAEALGVMDSETMMRAFEINTVGTFNVLSAVLPNLRLAAAQGLNPRVAVMSSRIGSMAANVKGGAYAYRASKAALNAVVTSMSVDVPEVCFAMVHPGRVETGLVCVKEDGAMSSEESLETLLPVLDRLGEGHLKSGCFLDRFGVEIPW